jgi:hypothetical protein
MGSGVHGLAPSLRSSLASLPFEHSPVTAKGNSHYTKPYYRANLPSMIDGEL